MIFIIFLLGGIHSLHTAIQNNILTWVGLIALAGVYIFGLLMLISLLYNLYKDKKNISYMLLGILLVIGYLIHPIFMIETVSLDLNEYLTNWFHWDLNLKMIFSLIFPVLLSFTILSISSVMKKKTAQAMLCLLSLVVLIGYDYMSMRVCLKSFSDYSIMEVMKAKRIKKVTTEKDTAVYAPSMGIPLYPGLFPIKYSFDTFHAKDNLILDTDTTKGSGAYVLASDGKKAGFIRDIY